MTDEQIFQILKPLLVDLYKRFGTPNVVTSGKAAILKFQALDIMSKIIGFRDRWPLDLYWLRTTTLKYGKSWDLEAGISPRVDK